ncbi:MAG: class I SAM-dependent methyltransferase [Treponema sp.]|nr:class I SAM-dependent methyltransferase [Treponema sp.]
MDSARFSIEKYKKDDIRAIDARFEAQKIAFAPLSFQAIRAMIELGMLNLIEDAGDEGLSRKEIAEKTNVSEYGVGVLCEMALGMYVIKLNPNSEEEKFTLGKVGWFLLNDNLTRVNFNFCNDICYKGAFKMKESVQNGKPEGLKEFSDKWTVIYEGLSQLDDRSKKSWFEFDHFYSDIAFPEALPIVFGKKPKTIVDIGGNTAKWSIACCKYNPDVHMTIVDLPGQTAVAEQNAAKESFADRISTYATNILAETTKLPDNPDAVWMSQFLDCFSLHQVTKILKKVHGVANENTNVYVLEPLWDKQQFEGNTYSLMGTSLYFTCMANGNSKMYRFQELVDAIEEAGFKLDCAHHNLGSQAYSLLVFKKK